MWAGGALWENVSKKTDRLIGKQTLAQALSKNITAIERK